MNDISGTVVGNDLDQNLSPKLLEKWKECLGDEYVLTNFTALQKFRQNVSGMNRQILAVLKPSSTDQVQSIVRIANQHRTPLYPFSCGKNWGFGSKLPMRNGGVIVELSRMDRIREVNADFHYAVIEPGVTQRKLYDYIQDLRLPLMMDVTGSGADTSVLGNSLERGIGYRCSRADVLSGLEIVLGNGTKLQTGFGHYSNAKATYLYKHGVGPSLDGLFSQSNFGIVTSAAIDLYPKPESHCAMMVRLQDPKGLVSLVNALAELRCRGVIKTVIHLANLNRTQITLGPLLYKNLQASDFIEQKNLLKATQALLDKSLHYEWSAVTGLIGSAQQIKEDQQNILRALRGIAEVSFLSESKLKKTISIAKNLSFLPSFRSQIPLLQSYEPLFGLTKGIPTNAALGSVYWAVEKGPCPIGDDLDSSHCGLLYCVPVTPMNGSSVLSTVQTTEEVFKRYQFEPYITVNFINEKALEFVINLAFNKEDSKQVEAAHLCMDELHDRLMAKGIYPYRAGLHSMNKILREEDPFWQTIRDLKQTLDPNNIIAPGKYNLV